MNRPVAVLLLLILATADTTNYSHELVRYVITIDAGSSGSRVHVHHYYRPEDQQQSIPSFNPASETLKLKPGLSSYEDTPHEAGDTIRGLLQFAKENIPEPKWKLTPVFLKATAGLRAIPEHKASQILKNCRSVINEFPFIFQDEHALIISGQDEGLFGWIAANYLMNRFTTETSADTIGVIEMGGASMQVSFEPDDKVSDDAIVDVRIGAVEYRVYTHSFLNYGLEKAQELLAEKLDNGESNPCYLEGAEFEGMNGAGSYDQCYTALDQIFDDSCPAKSCSFNGIYQPPIDNEDFVAIENFFYTSEFFDTVSSIKGLESAGRKFCEENWNTAMKQYSEEDDDQLMKYCFSSAYLSKVLVDGIGIKDPDDSVSVVRVVNGKAPVDWALGSVVYEVTRNADLIPEDWDLFVSSPGSVSTALKFQTILGLLAFGIVCVIIKHRMKGSSTGVRISKFSENYP